jgi:lysozyme
MATSNRTKLGAAAAITASLVAFVTLWEGTEYEAYLDIAGVPTVCSGITGPAVEFGRVYTKQECDDLLAKALAEHAEGFLRCVKVPLSENQRSAFISWTYNVGVKAACNSTLVKKLNAGDHEGACWELPKWDRAGGRSVPGLARRRMAETRMCLGIEPPPPKLLNKESP